jgi:hypothetical protein
VFAEKLRRARLIALQALIFTLRKRDEPRLEIGLGHAHLAEVDFDDIDEAEQPEEPESGEA